MPFAVRLHPEALLELNDGASFYGDTFVTQVEGALQRIADMPRTWPQLPGWPSLHRKVVKKIPYAIVYAIRNDEIFVIALEHTKRRPGYWMTRF